MWADPVIHRRVAPSYQSAFFGGFDEWLEAAVVVVYEAVGRLGSSRRCGENEECEDGEKRPRNPRR